MKRITNYALNCLIEQGISKEHIKSLIKAIENQTRDNILTPEQAMQQHMLVWRNWQTRIFLGSVEKSIEVRILELALQSSVIVCIRFINSIEGELLIANATVKQVLLFLFVNIYNYKYTDIMEKIIKIKIGDCKNRLEPIKVFNQHATAGISNL